MRYVHNMAILAMDEILQNMLDLLGWKKLKDENKY